MAWELSEAMAYYRTLGAPGDQSVLISLLREIQQQNGSGIFRHQLTQIAGEYGIPESLLLALIRRIPNLRLSDTHCLEICAGPNCSKRAALAAAAESLLKGDPRITLKTVPCMRMCGKGPNLRWDGTVYHRADEQLLRRLLGK